MSENIRHTPDRPLRLTRRGKAAVLAVTALTAVGAKDTGQGILNYIKSQNTPHYLDVDARVGEDGTTIWAIAHKAQPEGDISPLVDRLVREHHGTDIVQPGEHIAIHNGHLINPADLSQKPLSK